MLPRIRSAKNLPVVRHEAGNRIDSAAQTTRSRFATPDKHQIYADKRAEAESFLKALDAGQSPDPADYPYLSAEAGRTAPTMTELANLWLTMNQSWRQVAATIERITIEAKATVRTARSGTEIEGIVERTIVALNGIGDAPPRRPDPNDKRRRPVKPKTGDFDESPSPDAGDKPNGTT